MTALAATCTCGTPDGGDQHLVNCRVYADAETIRNVDSIQAKIDLVPPEYRGLVRDMLHSAAQIGMNNPRDNAIDAIELVTHGFTTD